MSQRRQQVADECSIDMAEEALALCVNSAQALAERLGAPHENLEELRETIADGFHLLDQIAAGLMMGRSLSGENHDRGSTLRLVRESA